jgi:hypothetical protein
LRPSRAEHGVLEEGFGRILERCPSYPCGGTRETAWSLWRRKQSPVQHHGEVKPP